MNKQQITIERLLDLYNINIVSNSEDYVYKLINREVEKRQEALISKHLY